MLKRVCAAILLAGFAPPASAAAPDGPIRAFTPRDLFSLEAASDPQISPDGSRIAYVRRSGDIMTDRMRPSIWLVDTRTGAPTGRPCDGVFVAIGHQPATELFRGQLDMKPSGYLTVRPGTCFTNVPGVFASGDLVDHHYRQAVTAAGTGCAAALDAERFISDLDHAATAATAVGASA